MRRTFTILLLCGAALVPVAGAAPHKTRNVIFVMTDGYRWQELFHGADAALMNKEHGGIENPEPLKKQFWTADAQERRKLLMPFTWTEIAAHGQIYGDRDHGSEAHVTNGLNFSYPGYSEALCGFPDPRVNSNDKIPNPNQTMMEWLNSKPAFHNRMAAFGAWDVFPYIFNARRSGLLVNAGWDAFEGSGPKFQLLNEMKHDGPRIWDDEPFDAIPFYTALEYLRQRRPRVMYLSLGETDDWAHGGRYDEYLLAAHRVDAYLKALWDAFESMPDYRNQTTLVVATDHGRGEGDETWKSHGEKLPESKYVWMMYLGPDTPPLGVRSSIPAVTQSQIAATIAALLGEDYHSAVPKSGAPIADVLRQ